MRTIEQMLRIADVGDLTLEETLELNAAAIAGLQDELSDGGIWMPRASGGSCKMCAIVDQLLCCLGRAMGAHSRLRYWMAQNGYAIGLPQSMILQNYTLGSTLLRELIEQVSAAIEFINEWREISAEDANLPESFKTG